MLIAALLLGIIATTQYHAVTHLIFLPLHIATCPLLSWKAGRRWGMAAANVAAGIAPLVVAARDPHYREPEVVLWNAIMRFIILQMCVLFMDRIRKQGRPSITDW